MWGFIHVVCLWGPYFKVDFGPSIFETGGQIICMALDDHWILGVGVVLDLHTIVAKLIWVG